MYGSMQCPTSSGRGEPGSFSHVRSGKRQTRGRRHLNCVWVYETQNRKRNKGSRQLTTCIYLSGVEYHTHRALKHSWLNNAQNVAFLLLSYLDYVMLMYKRYQALHVIHIRVPGEPGNEEVNHHHCNTLFVHNLLQLSFKNHHKLSHSTSG